MLHTLFFQLYMWWQTGLATEWRRWTDWRRGRADEQAGWRANWQDSQECELAGRLRCDKGPAGQISGCSDVQWRSGKEWVLGWCLSDRGWWQKMGNRCVMAKWLWVWLQVCAVENLCHSLGDVTIHTAYTILTTQVLSRGRWTTVSPRREHTAGENEAKVGHQLNSAGVQAWSEWEQGHSVTV